MKYFKGIAIVAFTLLLTACEVKPKEINYGSDHCLLCDMTVVDQSHSAEYVTKKGRAYMFDAVECLVGEINKSNNEDNLAYILVADYSNPGKLINAKEATYLISEAIKSPMGANLSAFRKKQDAEKILKESGGKLYSWEALKIELKN